MKNRIFKSAFLTLAVLTLAATGAFAQTQTRAKYTTPADAAIEFDRFFDLLNKDHDGAVSMADMLDAHNATDDPKAVARIKAWDKNRDGRIDRQEGSDGVKHDLITVVDDQMKVDTDGDGILSLPEYTLAVPDPKGEKTPSGLTRRQEIMFRGADTDNDNKYSRSEAIATNSYRWAHSYRGRYAAYRARVYDLNQDRQYDLTEFALIYGVKPGQPVPAGIQEKFKGASAAPANHGYYSMMMRIIHFPLTEMDELDERITAYQQSHDGAKAEAGQNKN